MTEEQYQAIRRRALEPGGIEEIEAELRAAMARPRRVEVGQVYRHPQTGQVFVVVEVSEDGTVAVAPWVPRE